jgi:hypothetical protein
LAAAPGATIAAVQAGVVLDTGHNGHLDHYLLLGHEWGQSFYGQLGRVLVRPGESVVAGQPVAIARAEKQPELPQTSPPPSGATPSGPPPTLPALTQPSLSAFRALPPATGTSPFATQTIHSAHLHFGLRVYPFSIDDGWCGFTDPEPYLRRLTQPLGSIMGPHIIGGVARHLDLLRRWQPRLITVLDPNPNEMAALRDVCRDSIIIGRIYVPDGELEARIRSDPEGAAEWAHALTMARFSPHVNYWQIANEIMQSPDGLPLLTRFELRRMQLARTALFFCAIFAFSVGNPDLPNGDRLGVWRLTFPALEEAERSGHVVAIHQYGKPDLFTPDQDWYGFRLEHQVLSRIPYKKVKFAISEYGIDGLINGAEPMGWQDFTTAQDYAGQLARTGRYAERYSGRVVGYSVFTLGANAPWFSYDINGPVADLLAAQPRGTWQDVATEGTGIQPGGLVIVTALPGGDTGPLVGPSTENPAGDEPAGEETGGQQPGSEEPGGGNGGTAVLPGDADINGAATDDDGDATSAESNGGTGSEGGALTASAGGVVTALITRRYTTWLEDLNYSIQSLASRPDNPAGDVVYLVKDLFTTYQGKWDVTGGRWTVPQWAKDAYLTGSFLEAGVDHHLMAAVIGLDGQFIKNHEIAFWSDGFDKLGDSGYSSFVRERTKEASGWANYPMGQSSAYNPDAGTSGPWCYMPAGPSEVLCGAGLPLGHQVTTFVVWQAVLRSELDGGTPTPPPTPPTPTPTEPVTPTPTPTNPIVPPPPPPPTPTPTPVTPVVALRKGSWVDYLRVNVKGIEQRPDQTAGDIVYLVKDIFTTRDGSWEPSGVLGGVDQWARDAYLKPFGAPDFFDDAGGDHHLFAAIIGLDGQLLRDYEVKFWSDGFDKLGDATYTGYVLRTTKSHSGWANIVLFPGSNFVPERGETGPFCWAPAGAAEVVCGGGMPAKQHVSTFVVWQAVKRSDLDPGDGGGDGEGGAPGDFNIFLPIITGGGTPVSTPAATPGGTIPPAAAGAEAAPASAEPSTDAPAAPAAVDARDVLAEHRLEETSALLADTAAAVMPAPLLPAQPAGPDPAGTDPTANSLSTLAMETMRRDAWGHLGIAYASGSTLVQHARNAGLGMPVTPEFETGAHVVQGYERGIVYALAEDRSQTGHMLW